MLPNKKRETKACSRKGAKYAKKRLEISCEKQILISLAPFAPLRETAFDYPLFCTSCKKGRR